MSQAWTLLFGPLAAPECSRASRRGWLIWVRMVPAFAAGIVAFFTVWLWWMSQRINPYHQPSTELRTALTIIEGMIAAFAIIMTPAVLAGSLAGDKERGSIGLLLTTRVNSYEIVLGRLAGRLSQVAMIELAALPALLLMAAMVGLGPGATLTLVGLPMALAFGSGGMALAASAMSRRGRDALLLLYLIEIGMLLAPLLRTLGIDSASLVSPFSTLPGLTWRDQLAEPLVTAGVWTTLGVIGLALASWRLRPSCLAEADGVNDRRRAKRRIPVPPVDEERPMLWKELHIERVGTLGRAGRLIGSALVLGLGLGSLFLAACAAYGLIDPAESAWKDWAINQASIWYGDSAIFIGFLIQWAIGLRAAVTISSEKERGTWDALMTSPLEGGEIIRGKLWGSLWALKWLVVSALLAWTITFLLGGMFGREYVEQLLGLAIIGPFMAAVGVRTSLRSATATKAMGITIGLWCCAMLGALVVAWIVCLLVTIVCLLGWLFAVQMGLTGDLRSPWFPTTWRIGQDLVFYSELLAGVFLIVAETRLRFDRVAGRMTAGKAALTIDHLIHGTPMAPILRDAKPKQPELDEVVG